MNTYATFARKAATPLVAMGLVTAAVPASAKTDAPIANADEAPVVTLVSGGCGIYAHRTVYGYCRPNVVGYRWGYGGYGYRGGYGAYRSGGWGRGYGWRRGW